MWLDEYMVPDPATFVNGVEQYGYSIEILYCEAVERFRWKILQLRSFTPEKIEEIVWETFLKQWGKMQRNVPKTGELTTVLYSPSEKECEKKNSRVIVLSVSVVFYRDIHPRSRGFLGLKLWLRAMEGVVPWYRLE